MPFYEVILNFDQDGEVAQNVLHYDVTAVTALDLQGYADQIRVDFISTILTQVVPSLSFDSITFREDLPGSVGTTVPFTLGAVVGTAPEDKYAGQLALIVRKLTNSLIRPNVGRVYLAGVSGNNLGSLGRWATATSTAGGDFITAIIGVESGAGGVMDMVIKASNPSAPNTVAYNPVLAAQGLGVPGTQRRRRQGVGV